MKLFQVRRSFHYDLTISARTEQEAILSAGSVPLAQWKQEETEMSAELIDETDEIDDY